MAHAPPRVARAPVAHIAHKAPTHVATLASPIMKQDVSMAARLSNMARLSKAPGLQHAEHQHSRVGGATEVTAPALDVVMEEAEEPTEGAQKPASNSRLTSHGEGKAASDAPTLSTPSIEDLVSRVDAAREQREQKTMHSLASDIAHVRRGLGNLRKNVVPKVVPPAPMLVALPVIDDPVLAVAPVAEPSMLPVVEVPDVPTLIASATDVIPAAAPAAEPDDVLQTKDDVEMPTAEMVPVPEPKPTSIWAAVASTAPSMPSSNLVQPSSMTTLIQPVKKVAALKKPPPKLTSLEKAAEALRKEVEEKAKKAALKEQQEARLREKRMAAPSAPASPSRIPAPASAPVLVPSVAAASSIPAPRKLFLKTAAPTKLVGTTGTMRAPVLKTLEEEDPAAHTTMPPPSSVPVSARATPKGQKMIPVSATSTLRINAEFAQIMSPVARPMLRSPETPDPLVDVATLPVLIQNPILKGNIQAQKAAGGKVQTLVDEHGELPDIPSEYVLLGCACLCCSY
jgi:hypothetical protein